MVAHSIWEVIDNERKGELVVIYDEKIGLVEDGEKLWIADAALLREAIEWARLNQIDIRLASKPTYLDGAKCPVWLLADLRKGDAFPFDIFVCTDVLERWGFGHLVPAFWGEDWEAF